MGCGASTSRPPSAKALAAERRASAGGAAAQKEMMKRYSPVDALSNAQLEEVCSSQPTASSEGQILTTQHAASQFREAFNMFDKDGRLH